ncbi:cation:proton antiporter domain-containing protein [Planctomicrobium sp. SH664]|uniref:cation:proton antiporter domain-containing protein n=1 Tax=Planctomicrobium sp. SH664 TaxID=3448125 RepID=UPI003F5B6BA0
MHHFPWFFSLASGTGMDDLPLITTVACGFTAAWVLGLLTQKFGLSPIVGYLLAGIAVGPHTPFIKADLDIAHQLAEIGVILLMFGVGLHFHLKDLLAVKWVAIPGALGQSAVATLCGLFAFTAMGLPHTASIVIGMAMAVASTVVLMRVLMDADVMNSPQGHVAVGWLLVEDILTVIVLVLIPVLGTDPTVPEAASQGLWIPLGMAFLKLGILVLIVMVGGARVVPWVLVQVARLRSRELFTLTVLVFSVAIAAGSYYFFGASMALGAFLAGMVVAQSPVSHQAAADALPMRDAFAVMFFVSVGMVFDPAFLIQQPLMIFVALVIILLIKPLAALLIVAVLGYPVRTALTVALALAQIGEFSFILSDLARKNHLMPDDGHNVLVASAIISITLNPILFRCLVPIENWLRRHPLLWKIVNGRAESRVQQLNIESQHEIAWKITGGEKLAIVVGFGPVGRSVHRLLTDAGLSTVVIDMNMNTINELKEKGQSAIFGDATHEGILEQAGMKHATHLVLTLPHSSSRIPVVTAARNLNEDARILVRAHYLSERELLEDAGATAAVFEEAEAAVALARLVLAGTGENREAVERKVLDLRLQLILENMSNIHTQKVRDVMAPWRRVHRLSTLDGRQDVLRKVGEQHFSRWPVTDSTTGKVIGYLLAKDLIAEGAADGEWTHLVRPVRAVSPDSDIASTLQQMQVEGVTLCMVEDRGAPVGVITLEDILEQVVGRIEDEYPHEERVLTLHDAVEAGGVVLHLQGHTPEEVIRELAAVIPPSRLPAGTDVAELAISREGQGSTDLGVGIAAPHARVANLAAPLVVFGRSEDGVLFSPETARCVPLVFLFVTPLDQLDVHLTLLAQLARVAATEESRERLLRATTETEVLDILAGADSLT